MDQSPVYCRFKFDEFQFHYARACAAGRKERWYRLKLLGFAIFLLLLCSYTAYLRFGELWRGGQFHWESFADIYFPFFICLFVFAIFVFGVNPYQQLRAFRKSLAFNRDYVYAIDEKAISLKTADVQSTIKWSLLDRAIESQYGLVLRLKKTEGFDWLPKTGFASITEFERCRAIIGQHIEIEKK